MEKFPELDPEIEWEDSQMVESREDLVEMTCTIKPHPVEGKNQDRESAQLIGSESDDGMPETNRSTYEIKNSTMEKFPDFIPEVERAFPQAHEDLVETTSTGRYTNKKQDHEQEPVVRIVTMCESVPKRLFKRLTWPHLTCCVLLCVALVIRSYTA